MNFYIFSAQYLPTVGGVERYTNSLAKELISKGHSVTVITSKLAGMKPEEVDADGINIIRLPVIPVMSGRFPVLKLSKQLKKFKKDFAENKPDFCVIQTRFYTSSIMAARLCSKYKVPSIVIEHGTAHLMRGGITGFAGNIYEHIVCRYIYKKCPDFYGVSLACCRWLSHFGIKTDKTLYNSITPEAVDKIANKGMAPLLKRLNEDLSEKTKIIFSARFIPEKGVMQLISAFNRLKNKYSDIVLIMAGDGPLWEDAKKFECKDIIFTSRIPYEENIALIKFGDIFCLPTFSEGFATTILEAAAVKTYIVTTPTGGTPQLVLNREYGTLMPDMSEKSIYDALDSVLSDKNRLSTAPIKTFDNLNASFTWEKTCEKLLSIAFSKKKV